MYTTSIDCRITNTIIYIVDELGRIHGKGARTIEVRDTSISRRRELLKVGVKEAGHQQE